MYRREGLKISAFVGTRDSYTFITSNIVIENTVHSRIGYAPYFLHNLLPYLAFPQVRSVFSFYVELFKKI